MKKNLKTSFFSLIFMKFNKNSIYLPYGRQETPYSTR